MLSAACQRLLRHRPVLVTAQQRFLQKQRKGLGLRVANFLKGDPWFENKPPFKHFVQVGDPVLRTKAKPVNFEQSNPKELQKIADSLRHVLDKYDGAGASAPQIGVPLRIMAIQCTESQLRGFEPRDLARRGMEPIPFTVVINPKISVLDDELVEDVEACCSVYGYNGAVKRHKEIELKGYELSGNKMKPWICKGWTARIIQHEMDHLDGVLYTDKLVSPQSLSFTYWDVVNHRKGRFKLSYGGVKSILNLYYPKSIVKHRV